MSQPVSIKDVEELQEVLESEGIRVSLWESPSVVEALFRELQAGECQLLRQPLERGLRIVRLELHSKQSGLILIEDSVEHSDGRFQQRGRLLSEKMLHDEAPSDCARRAVAEELPIADITTIEIDSVSTPSIEFRESTPSYPGLKSRYEIYDVVATVAGLPKGDFSTEEFHEESLVSIHRWHWASEKPVDQN